MTACLLPASASPANHRSAYASGRCRCAQCKAAKAAYVRGQRQLASTAKRDDA